MGQQSTGDGGSKTQGQMTGKSSPTTVLPLPSNSAPKRDIKTPTGAGSQGSNQAGGKV